MSNIDKAEATMAVVGMDAVISDEVEKITGADKKRIARLENEIKDLAPKMIRGSLKPKSTLPPDYISLLDSLTSPMNIGQVEKMISVLPNEIQTSFMALASGIYKYLQDNIPKNTQKTIAGIRQLTVNDPDYFKFHWVYSVLCDPLYAMKLISAGMLFRSQADAVRLFFPSISEAIDNAIDEAIPEARASDAAFEVPMEPDIGLRIWRSLPVTKGNYQNVYFDANQERKKQQDPSESQLDHYAASMASPAEQQQYPKAV